MSVNKSDLNKYCNEVYDKDVEDIKDNDKLFEALSESIAKLHPEFYEDTGKIEKEFNNSDKETLEGFVEYKFDQYVDKSLFGVINKAHKNKWIDYSVEMLRERGL